MRISLSLVLIVAFLIPLSACSERRRFERLEGSWQALGAGNQPERFKDEMAKLSITFGKKGDYSQTATCNAHMKRTGAEYSCDDGKPVKGEYLIKKIERDKLVYVNFPPSGDLLEVEFKDGEPDRMYFKMWAGLGDQVIFKKAE